LAGVAATLREMPVPVTTMARACPASDRKVTPDCAHRGGERIAPGLAIQADHGPAVVVVDFDRRLHSMFLDR
jgi:hypothetical protein